MNQKKIKEESVYEGRTFSLYKSNFETAEKKVLERDIIKRKSAVGILAVTSENLIVLVKQYRQAIEDAIWEIPAGIINDNESAIDTAKRELAEETGYQAEQIHEMVHYYSSPGFTDEEVIIFKAIGLRFTKPQPDEEEEFEITEINLKDALTMVKEGKIIDAKSIIAILLLADEESDRRL